MNHVTRLCPGEIRILGGRDPPNKEYCQYLAAVGFMSESIYDKHRSGSGSGDTIDDALKSLRRMIESGRYIAPTASLES